MRTWTSLILLPANQGLKSQRGERGRVMYGCAFYLLVVNNLLKSEQTDSYNNNNADEQVKFTTVCVSSTATQTHLKSLLTACWKSNHRICNSRNINNGIHVGEIMQTKLDVSPGFLTLIHHNLTFWTELSHLSYSMNFVVEWSKSKDSIAALLFMYSCIIYIPRANHNPPFILLSVTCSIFNVINDGDKLTVFLYVYTSDSRSALFHYFIFFFWSHLRFLTHGHYKSPDRCLYTWILFTVTKQGRLVPGITTLLTAVKFAFFIPYSYPSRDGVCMEKGKQIT